MRHPVGVLDEALDASEALGQRPDLRPRDEVDRLLLRLDEERHHAPEVTHLPCCDLVAGMVRQAGVEHLGHGRVILQEGDHGPCVLAVLAHADGERLQAAEHEPRVERAGHCPERLLQEAEPLRDRGVVRAREPSDHVRVPAEVLGGRVNDDVGAELERLLQVRRRERVVDHEDRAGGVRCICGGTDVDDVEQGIRGRLDPDHPRALVDVSGEVGRDLLRCHVVEDVALRLVDLGEHPIRAAVDVVHADDALARVDEVHDRHRRSDT